MNWPLLILYMITFLSLLIAANQHGKPKEGTHNFWTSVVAAIITIVLIVWLNGWRVYP